MRWWVGTLLPASIGLFVAAAQLSPESPWDPYLLAGGDALLLVGVGIATASLWPKAKRWWQLRHGGWSPDEPIGSGPIGEVVAISDDVPNPTPQATNFPPTAGYYSFGDRVELSLLHPDRYRVTAMICAVQGPNGVTASTTAYSGFGGIGENRYRVVYPDDFKEAPRFTGALPRGTYYVTWTTQNPYSHEPATRLSFSLDEHGL